MTLFHTKKREIEKMEKILICGYGISGRAAAKLAAAQGKTVIIADEHTSIEMRVAADALRKEYPEQITFLSGWQPGHPLPACSDVVLSPGIRKTSALYQAAKKAMQPGGRWFSELEFALQNIHCPFVSITGTNGKTTTTELTTALLRAHGLKAESSGNIGAALSECALEAEKRQIDFLVIETSSFQLENIPRFPACPAAVLNLASDHIDRHGSMEEYARTKFKVFAEPLPPEQRILNRNLIPWLNRFLPGTEVTTFSAVDPEADFTLPDQFIRFRNRPVFDLAKGELRGLHNAENMMAALALLRAVRGEEALFLPQTADALAAFRCSPHRMEVFAKQNGILYVNDSKATNPHAVNAVVRQFADGRNLLLILGGLDKGMDFSELQVSFPAIKQAFLVGSCREALFTELSGHVPCKLSVDFDSAVRDACAAARPGDVVMLSPATASMDLFKNYAERGETFKRLVRENLRKTASDLNTTKGNANF